MFGQFFAIVRNTFFESIRQPVMLVILAAATLFIFLCIPLSAYTMEDDQRMYIDMGLATIFLCGVLLSALIATNVLTREIDNKTVLTVVSKPVTRPVFFLGKFVGVALALALGTLYMALVFMIIEVHGTMPTLATKYHLPVIIFGVSAALIGVTVGVWCNYFYNRVFGSTVICVTTPLLGVAYFLCLLFNKSFEPQSMTVSFRPELWLASASLLMAILMLTAVAVAASTRLNQTLTLMATFGVFLLGLLSDWMFGRPIRGFEDQFARMAEAGHPVSIGLTSTPGYLLSKVAYAIIPNYQVLWLSDAITQKQPIPLSYVGMTLSYGTLFTLAALALGIIMFQRREVG